MRGKLTVGTYVRRDGQVAKLCYTHNGHKRRLIVRHCVVCGAVFFANRTDARYCGAACKQKMYRVREKARRARHAEKLAQLTLKGVL